MCNMKSKIKQAQEEQVRKNKEMRDFGDEFEAELKADAKRRTAKRNEPDTLSVVAMVAGIVLLLALLWYAGEVTDAIISTLELTA